MENKFGTGAIKDSLDPRDILLSSFQEMVSVPSIYDPRSGAQKPFVSSQGKIGSCTGHSGQTMKEWQQFFDSGGWHDLSARWVYAQNKLVDGITSEGSTSRNSVKTLTEIGVCFDDEFPELNTQGHEFYINLSLVAASASTSASFNKSSGYARIGLTKTEITQAIYQNKAVLLAVPLSFEGWRTAFVRPPKEGEKTTGHSVCAIGFNDNAYIVENSWGSGWGEGGYCFIPFTYPLWDCWTSVDVPEQYLNQAKKLMKTIRLRGTKDVWAVKGNFRHLILNAATFSRGVEFGWWPAWDKVVDVEQIEFDSFQEGDVLISIPSN